jgi:hypothetical protein
MQSVLCDLSNSAARADALFASALQRSDEPSTRQVEQAIAAALGAFGERGCAARVAQAYGEHPETAVTRMRWARTVVVGTFGTRSSESARGPGVSQDAVPGAPWTPGRGGLNPLALASLELGLEVLDLACALAQLGVGGSLADPG